MPFYDLNVAYTGNAAELSNTLAFHAELGYGLMAIAIAVTGKLPAQLEKVHIDDVTIPKSLQLQTRLTLTISDTSQNHRLSSLTPVYDLIALRPTNDKAFQLCCSSLECDIISLDFSQRLPFPLKFKTAASALQRGIRFEICYSPGTTGGNDARRNLISGAAALIRATRGRGVIISSEARNALGVRGPWDVINLAQVWGLNQERAKESLCEEAGKVLRLANIKRTSFRGVVDIIDDGSRPSTVPKPKQISSTEASAEPSKTSSPVPSTTIPGPTNTVTVLANKGKRKASSLSLKEVKSEEKPVSKREMKRRAKKARLEKAAGQDQENDQVEVKKQSTNGFEIKHETLMREKK